MRSALAGLVLAAAALAPGSLVPLLAQGPPRRAQVPNHLLALARSNLTFGTVLPGIPSSVNAHDPHRSALFEIRGPSGAAVRVELVLPDALTNDVGGLLPILFGSADGFAFSHEGADIGIVFNPHNPLIGTLGAGGRMFVRLGGTVLPGRPQTGGSYFASIMLVVYDLGS